MTETTRKIEPEANQINWEDLQSHLTTLTASDSQHKDGAHVILNFIYPKSYIENAPVATKDFGKYKKGDKLPSGYEHFNLDEDKEIESMVEWIAEHQSKGAGIYYCLHEFGKDGDSFSRKSDNCSRIRCLSVDIDWALPKYVIDKLRDAVFPSVVVASSRDDSECAFFDEMPKYKTQWLWLFGDDLAAGDSDFQAALLDPKMYRRYQRGLAHAVEEEIERILIKEYDIDVRETLTEASLEANELLEFTDKKVVDLARVFRVAGTFHTKNPDNLFKVEILTDIEEALPLNDNDEFSAWRKSIGLTKEFLDKTVNKKHTTLIPKDVAKKLSNTSATKLNLDVGKKSVSKEGENREDWHENLIEVVRSHSDIFEELATDVPGGFQPFGIDFDAVVTEGGRNEVTALLARSLFVKGRRSRLEVGMICHLHNLQCCNPPQEPEEVDATIDSIYAWFLDGMRIKAKEKYFERIHKYGSGHHLVKLFDRSKDLQEKINSRIEEFFDSPQFTHIDEESGEKHIRVPKNEAVVNRRISQIMRDRAFDIPLLNEDEAELGFEYDYENEVFSTPDSDLSIVHRMVQRFAEEFMWVPEIGVHIYNSEAGVWEVDKQNKVTEAYETVINGLQLEAPFKMCFLEIEEARKAAKEGKKVSLLVDSDKMLESLKGFRSSGKSSGVLKLFKEHKDIAVPIEGLDADIDSLNCKGGVVSLVDGEITAASPDMQMTRIAGVDLNVLFDDGRTGAEVLQQEVGYFLGIGETLVQSQAPENSEEINVVDEITSELHKVVQDDSLYYRLFGSVVLDVMNNDLELFSYFWRSLGYLVSGRANEKNLFYLYGPGANNGKSTVVDTMTQIMNPDANGYAGFLKAESFYVKKGVGNANAFDAAMARCAQARFVGVSEFTKGQRIDEANIKQLTGGEPVMARFLRKDPFIFYPKFTPLMQGNFPLFFDIKDMGMRDRLVMIPCYNRFAKSDIKERLLDPRIMIGNLAFVIAGAQLYFKYGLGEIPQVAQECMRSHIADLTNPIERFIEEEFIQYEVDGYGFIKGMTKRETKDFWKDKAITSMEFAELQKEWANANDEERLRPSKADVGKMLRKLSIPAKRIVSEGGSKETKYALVPRSDVAEKKKKSKVVSLFD